MWGILGGLDAADPGLKLSGMRGTSPPAEPASSKSLGGHLWAGIPPARGARFRPFEQRRHDPGHPPACGAPRPAVHALPPDGVSAVHLRNTAPGDLPRHVGYPMLQKPLAAGCAFRVSRASAGHAGLVADLPRHTGVSAGDRRIAHRHEIFPGIRWWDPYEIDDDTPDFQNFPCIRGYPTDECSFSLNGILSPACGGIRHVWGLPTRRIFPGMRGYPVFEGTRIFTKGCVIEGCV